MLVVQEWLNCKLRMVLHYIISSSSLGIFKKMQCSSNQPMSCKCPSLNCFIYKRVLKHSPFYFAFQLCSFLPAQFLGSQKYQTVALLDLLASLLLSGVQSYCFLECSARGCALPTKMHCSLSCFLLHSKQSFSSVLEGQPVTGSEEFPLQGSES